MLSSHLITSCIIQSEQGSRSLVVPADSKERDERQRERKGNGRIGEDRSEQRDSEGTVNEMTLTFHEELYVQERGEKKAHLGRNSIDSLCNIAAIKTPMLGVRRTKTNVSLSRAGSDSTVLTTAPAHIRF